MFFAWRRRTPFLAPCWILAGLSQTRLEGPSTSLPPKYAKPENFVSSSQLLGGPIELCSGPEGFPCGLGEGLEQTLRKDSR